MRIPNDRGDINPNTTYALYFNLARSGVSRIYRNGATGTCYIGSHQLNFWLALPRVTPETLRATLQFTKDIR
jgi:hypothetical protein